MAKITWLEKTKDGNSKSRRRERRKAERLKQSEDLALAKKVEHLLAGCSGAVLKALNLPTSSREPPVEPTIKDDAAFHVVNHAHQRDPKKKWS